MPEIKRSHDADALADLLTHMQMAPDAKSQTAAKQMPAKKKDFNRVERTEVVMRLIKHIKTA